MMRGTRVVMSKAGRKHLIKPWTVESGRVAKGVFVGYTNDGRCWRILRDGHKGTDVYHPSFWSRQR